MHERKNLVLIVSDTQRKDHLSFYGNSSIHTENLERLAKKSTVFEHFYSASFPTVPARADLLTGKWTFPYLGWAPMPEGETVLPQILGEAGYATFAAVDTPFYMRDGFRYDHAFDIFTEIYGQGMNAKLKQEHIVKRRMSEEDYFAPRTMMEAQRLLEKNHGNGKPFFLLVDTWDPHEPWDPPAWYVERYRPNYDGTVVYPTYGRTDAGDVTKEEVDLAHDCYRGEISMVDHWVGSLLMKLEDMNLMDDTIIVYSSDHGFYFGEHGIFGKSIKDNSPKFSKEERWRGDWLRSPLYEEAIHVPLVICHPDYEPKHVSNLGSFVDLMPTILDLLGIERPTTVQGKSLAGAVKGDESFVGEQLVVTSPPLSNPGTAIKIVDSIERRVREFLPSTITTHEWSLIYSAKGEIAELYNLEKDPKQKKDVIGENPDVARRLHSDFLSVLKSCKVDPRLLKPREEITI
ncbi:MAG: sulfatase [Nitrososphaerota archaeon]|nr:sulfatase [Nitrososphaerota archaeon]